MCAQGVLLREEGGGVKCMTACDTAWRGGSVTQSVCEVGLVYRCVYGSKWVLKIGGRLPRTVCVQEGVCAPGYVL